jgi:flagellar biosynthesis/type III secretory pathway protein FliH
VYDAGTIWDEGMGGLIEAFKYVPEGNPEACIESGCEALFPGEPDAEPCTLEPSAATPAHSPEDLHREWEKRLAEETQRAFDAGCQQGLKTEREAHATALRAIEDRRRCQAGELLDSFAQERDRYLRSVEQEVVHLALAVAARILRREAQMDPLLLTGAVRVALGQLSGSTWVRLRIPAEDRDLWQQAIAHLPNLQIRPEIVADASMRLGDCVFETGVGSVDLGLRSQLAEIERGFFDRAPGGRLAEGSNTASGSQLQEVAP